MYNQRHSNTRLRESYSFCVEKLYNFRKRKPLIQDRVIYSLFTVNSRDNYTVTVFVSLSNILTGISSNAHFKDGTIHILSVLKSSASFRKRMSLI